jgi:hypothetical protein
MAGTPFIFIWLQHLFSAQRPDIIVIMTNINRTASLSTKCIAKDQFYLLGSTREILYGEIINCIIPPVMDRVTQLYTKGHKSY